MKFLTRLFAIPDSSPANTPAATHQCTVTLIGNVRRSWTFTPVSNNSSNPFEPLIVWFCDQTAGATYSITAGSIKTVLARQHIMSIDVEML